MTHPSLSSWYDHPKKIFATATTTTTTTNNNNNKTTMAKNRNSYTPTNCGGFTFA
jgi:hypothetical protein